MSFMNDENISIKPVLKICILIFIICLIVQTHAVTSSGVDEMQIVRAVIGRFA